MRQMRLGLSLLDILGASGRSHKETWEGCIVSLTTLVKSSLKASRSVSSLSLAENVLDASGRELLSRTVENDQAGILKLIDEALSFAKEIVWALDQSGGGAALLLALFGALVGTRSERSLYIPLASP